MKPLSIPRKALRIDSVIERTGISKTQLYRLIQSGEFPRGTNLSARIVAWDEASVNKWLEAKFEGEKQ